MKSKIYEQLANDFGKAVDDGVLKPGDRLPSIRQTADAHRLSITTVKRAYILLESRGLVEARPQAGYFVCSTKHTLAIAAPSLTISMPEPVGNKVDVARHVLTTFQAIASHNAIPLGSPYPDPALFPWRRISQHSNAITKRFDNWSAVNDIPPGHPDLIRQIARRHLQNGLHVAPEDIVVTIGATEAINLCLQAVAKPGDTIAIESPSYYAMLQAIERNGMRAVELPTHPEEGIDLAALEALVCRQRIDACLTMPNFQNPLGFEMSDANKKSLVDLAVRYNMPLIENGVYNEFHYRDSPPTTLKCHDTTGIVLFCGSFSKSLTAGVRVGWALPGRYRQEVEKLKFLNTLATPAIPQLAIAEFLSHDGWDHHLRSMRQTLAQRADIMRSMVGRFFPEGTRMSRPKGGYLLWLEVPGQVDTLKIQREALERGITLAPGRVFSNAGLYSSFMRLNYSYPWTAEVETAIKTLGLMSAPTNRGTR
jgi:DNA-binding transcriptional MocR family regulator